jgi:hypothetical protein
MWRSTNEPMCPTYATTTANGSTLWGTTNEPMCTTNAIRKSSSTNAIRHVSTNAIWYASTVYSNTNEPLCTTTTTPKEGCTKETSQGT